MIRFAQYVYVAQVGVWSKVGITNDVARRMKRLALETGLEVALIKRWRVGNLAGDVEAICIYDLRSHLAPLGREFFTLSTDDLIVAVEKSIRRVRCGERRLKPRDRHRLRYHERKREILQAQVDGQ